MLQPAIALRRVHAPSLLVSFAFVTGALVGVAGPLPVVVVEKQPAMAKTAPTTVFAQTSPLNLSFDLLGTDAYQADGTLDEVFDVEVRSAVAVRHIFLHAGRDATPHLGVRANGAWITNAQTGALEPLPAGTNRLELIATGVRDNCPRAVTVMFVDGTTVTDVIPMTWTAYSPADDCGGDRDQRAAKP